MAGARQPLCGCVAQWLYLLLQSKLCEIPQQTSYKYERFLHLHLFCHAAGHTRKVTTYVADGPRCTRYHQRALVTELWRHNHFIGSEGNATTTKFS